VDLAVACGRPLLARQPFPPDVFDEVILGCAAPRADEMNPARVAALRLGCGQRMPAWTVHRNCGSGMQSVETAWRYIADGRAELILAGGAEALSHTPLQFNTGMVNWLADLNEAKGPVARLKAFTRFRPRFLKPVISLMRGLTDYTVELNMGQTAEVLAHRFAISREEADTYAVRSHKRLAVAQEKGYLVEVEPVFDRDGKLYDRDDGVRPDSSIESLAKLRPAFEPPWGKVTAGNSSQITDGACWLIVASEEAVNHWGLTPMGRILDSQWSALDPAQMGLGPAHASAALLRRNGLSLSDIDAWESDELSRSELGLDSALGTVDQERLNVDGGAISLGHPVGTSGARITLHLLHVLKRMGGRRGVATLCIGGGQGGALLVERV
jgi:acetyl-CoA C-acetyltransferase